jgi:hypothetical protein
VIITPSESPQGKTQATRDFTRWFARTPTDVMKPPRRRRRGETLERQGMIAGGRSRHDATSLRPRFLALCTALAFGLAGCLGADDSSPPGDASESATPFTGERGQIAGVVEAYETAIAEDDAVSLCREVIRVDPQSRRHGYGSNGCAEDPDNDAVSAEAESDLSVVRVAFLPRRPNAPRAPDEIPRWQVEDSLMFLPSAIALARETDRDDGVLTAFGLSRFDGQWLIVNRMLARQVKVPRAAHARRKFFRRHGLLGALGIAQYEPGRKCPGGSEGAASVTGTVTMVRAPSARAAILRSRLTGPIARKAMTRGGELELLSVDYPEQTRHFQLRSRSGGGLSVPVVGTGPTYYVNDFGGCAADRVVKQLIGGDS